MRQKRRLYTHVGRAILVMGLIVLIAFEGVWRLRIAAGPESKKVISFVSADGEIQRRSGVIESISIERYRSSFAWSIGGGLHGRFHVRVKGSKESVDLLVWWHEDDHGRIFVDRVKNL